MSSTPVTPMSVSGLIVLASPKPSRWTTGKPTSIAHESAAGAGPVTVVIELPIRVRRYCSPPWRGTGRPRSAWTQPWPSHQPSTPSGATTTDCAPATPPTVVVVSGTVVDAPASGTVVLGRG